MSNAEIPGTVIVGQHVYTIHCDEESWARLCRNDTEAAGSLMGRCRHHESEIFIRPGMSESQTRDTALHEILHVIFAVGMGGESAMVTAIKADDVEEHLVVTMTPWLLSTLACNPQLIAYLTGGTR